MSIVMRQPLDFPIFFLILFDETTLNNNKMCHHFSRCYFSPLFLLLFLPRQLPLDIVWTKKKNGKEMQLFYWEGLTTAKVPMKRNKEKPKINGENACGNAYYYVESFHCVSLPFHSAFSIVMIVCFSFYHSVTTYPLWKREQTFFFCFFSASSKFVCVCVSNQRLFRRVSLCALPMTNCVLVVVVAVFRFLRFFSQWREWLCQSRMTCVSCNME